MSASKFADICGLRAVQKNLINLSNNAIQKNFIKANFLWDFHDTKTLTALDKINFIKNPFGQPWKILLINNIRMCGKNKKNRFRQNIEQKLINFEHRLCETKF